MAQTASAGRLPVAPTAYEAVCSASYYGDATALTSVRKTIVRRVVDDAIPDSLPADLHPVLKRTYRARQVYAPHELDRSVERGTDLYVQRTSLPTLPEGSYYVDDLVGLGVYDPNGTRVGVIRDVLPGPANDALELDTGLLLPLVEDCVREIDLERRRILLNPGYTE